MGWPWREHQEILIKLSSNDDLVASVSCAILTPDLTSSWHWWFSRRSKLNLFKSFISISDRCVCVCCLSMYHSTSQIVSNWSMTRLVVVNKTNTPRLTANCWLLTAPLIIFLRKLRQTPLLGEIEMWELRTENYWCLISIDRPTKKMTWSWMKTIKNIISELGV